jgi:hypothetical protein
MYVSEERIMVTWRKVNVEKGIYSRVGYVGEGGRGGAESAIEEQI